MGTLGDNGGNRPPDNGGQPDPVPDLPPEWGVIVIPDDPAELAEEAASVRRQLRREARSDRWRRRLHLPRRGSTDDNAAVGIPLLIMTIAVLATLTSLFAVAWPGSRPVPKIGTETSAGQTVQTPAVPAAPAVDVPLTDLAGGTARLRDTLPAVVVLVDGCQCHDLLAAVAAAADPSVTVVAVAGAPALNDLPGQALPSRVRLLFYHGSDLGAAMSVANRTPGRAAVLLFAADGALVKAIPAANSVDDFRADLARLAGH
jgi:hypothetical protein